MDLKPIEQIAEVLERIPGTPYAKRIRCRICDEEVFSVKDDCRQEEIDAEMTRMKAHMAIQHQIHIEEHKCDDPNCVD